MSKSVGWDPKEGSALICVVIVMRMIIAYTDQPLRQGGNETDWAKTQSEAEEKNVLLKYAWHDTSRGVEKTGGIGPNAVRRLQEEVYMELMDAEGPWAKALSSGLTFEGLMESQPMWEHFWSRLELQKETGAEVEQKHGWMPLQPAMDAGGRIPLSSATLSEKSLVRWSAGEESLVECLLRSPTRFDDQGREFLRVQGWSVGVQKCIRVLYNPGSELDGPGFRDLVEVSIAPKVLEMGQQGARWMEGGVQRYRLVAAVRLSTLESPEYLRIYDKAGRYSVPRVLSEQAFICLNGDWELGQAGFRYMLYYARASSTDPGVESTEERPPSTIRETVAKVADELQQSSVALQDISSGPPRAAPTEPKAHRDRAAKKPQASGPGLNPNSIPLGPPRTRRFDEESPAGPSRVYEESGGDGRTLDPPANEKSANKQGFDPRRRSNQPGALEGFRDPMVDPKQSPRRTVGQPAEYDDISRPARKRQTVPQPENAPAEAEGTSGQPSRHDPRRNADEPRRHGDAWAPGAFSSQQPAERPEKRRRRNERP